MAIFRVLGGNSSGTRSTNLTSSAARGSAHQPQSSNNQQPQQQIQQPQQQQQQRTSRLTYPGMRISQHGPPPSGSMPMQPPRVGGSMNGAVNNPLMMMSSSMPGGVIVRGSNPGLAGSSGVGGVGGGMESLLPSGSAPHQHPAPPAQNPAAMNPAAMNHPTGAPTNRPGAYAVTRTTVGPAQVYRVTVPPGVRPGAEFTVHAGQRRVRVRCPNDSRPGHSLQITLPPEPTTHNTLLRMAPVTNPYDDASGGGTVTMTPEVKRVNQAATESGGTAQTFLVTIPPDVYPGMQFTVNVEGQRFMVTCPSNAGPNMKVRIVPPTQREEPLAAPKTQVFEVTVPPGVRPSQPFTLMANGQRVLVTCPPNVSPGQKIRFQLPVQQALGSILLSYESEKDGGWCRTIRVNDLKFQWVRTTGKKGGKGEDGDGKALDDMQTFDFSKAAYVRKIQMLEGNDARMRTGKVTLVPAQEAVVESKLMHHGKAILSYSDIANYQTKPLDVKSNWFYDNVCSQLTPPWEEGHVKLVVRRRHLLSDSVDAVMSLGREDMRKRWRIEFLGEPGIDAGGVTREWFQLVTEAIFDPDFGLWLSSVNNQMCMTINPASGTACPDEHLVYFRFLGRVLGRALFDRQLVKGHMVRHLYKHLLGWPITFEDLEQQEEEYYTALKKLTTMDDLSIMCLDFTITEEEMGVRRDVELIPGGNTKEVTSENLSQYLEANLRYRMLDRTKPQITELLLGFFDIVPEPALTVFDPNELELILCGLPTIDMDDWINNTIYSGIFEMKGKRDKTVEWFWETVRTDFDQEMKARLLQFVTGTSGVPTRGFSVLQGNDGNIKKFAIHGVDRNQYVYPRAHTCFNRIDLPNYTSKKELYEKLKTAVTMSAVGFDIE